MQHLTRHTGGVQQAQQERSHVVIVCREESSTTDRRATPRTPVALRVDYTDAQGRAGWGIARNLSEGGLFLEYTPGVAVGETLTVTLVLPQGLPYKGEAQVMHRNARGAGLRFVGRRMPEERWPA